MPPRDMSTCRWSIRNLTRVVLVPFSIPRAVSTPGSMAPGSQHFDAAPSLSAPSAASAMTSRTSPGPCTSVPGSRAYYPVSPIPSGLAVLDDSRIDLHLESRLRASAGRTESGHPATAHSTRFRRDERPTGPSDLGELHLPARPLRPMYGSQSFPFDELLIASPTVDEELLPKVNEDALALTVAWWECGELNALDRFPRDLQRAPADVRQEEPRRAASHTGGGGLRCPTLRGVVGGFWSRWS